MMKASVRKRGGEISGICVPEALRGEGGSLQSSGSPTAHLERKCRNSRADGEQKQPVFRSVYAAQRGKKQ